MSTLIELRIRWKQEAYWKMKKYTDVNSNGSSVLSQIKWNNKPRGRAMKVANRLIKKDMEASWENRMDNKSPSMNFAIHGSKVSDLNPFQRSLLNAGELMPVKK